MQAQQWTTAIDYAMRFLLQDPVAEHIHRRLMLCYSSMGNRPAAIRQFETCRQRLSENLGVSPLPETISAFEAIYKESNDDAGPVGPVKRTRSARREAFAEVLHSLNATRDSMMQACRLLDTSISKIRRTP
jgi:DNA-binding SARP family transcriptional activator